MSFTVGCCHKRLILPSSVKVREPSEQSWDEHGLPNGRESRHLVTAIVTHQLTLQCLTCSVSADSYTSVKLNSVWKMYYIHTQLNNINSHGSMCLCAWRNRNVFSWQRSCPDDIWRNVKRWSYRVLAEVQKQFSCHGVHIGSCWGLTDKLISIFCTNL